MESDSFAAAKNSVPREIAPRIRSCSIGWHANSWNMAGITNSCCGCWLPVKCTAKPARFRLQLLDEDRDNIWLARGPRVRLSAEMIRDQSLALADCFREKCMAFRFVHPSPAWDSRRHFGSDTDWKTSQGEDRYRRGLYTSWRRSNPYPSMATFDAPSREVCTLRRDSTNTPSTGPGNAERSRVCRSCSGLARRVVTH